MMRKSNISFGFMLLMAVMMLASCSKSPKVSRLMPDDAITMRIDVKQIFEKSKAGDNEKAKAQITETLNSFAKNEEGKKLMQEIADDPAKAGIDLREPLWVSTDVNGKSTMILGELLSADDFIKMLTVVDGTAPQEKDGIHYAQEGKNIVAFDDDVFVLAEGSLDEIIRKFKNEDTKGTMAESDDLAKINGCDGIVQMLIPMGCTESQLKEEAKKMLPNGAELKDLSLLLDLNSEKGALTLTMEAIVKSDAWQKLYDKSSKVAKKLDGDFAQYLSADGLVMFCNVDGKAYAELLDQLGFFNMRDLTATGKTDDVKKVINSIDGDIALGINKWEGFVPDVVLYVKTKDNNMTETLNANGFKSSDELQIGSKDGVSYITFGAKPFEAAATPVSKSDLSGHRFYLRLGAPLANKAMTGLAGGSARTAQPLLDTVKSLEIYDTGNTTAVMRLNMKDADKDPIELATDLLMKSF